MTVCSLLTILNCHQLQSLKGGRSWIYWRYVQARIIAAWPWSSCICYIRMLAPKMIYFPRWPRYEKTLRLLTCIIALYELMLEKMVYDGTWTWVGRYCTISYLPRIVCRKTCTRAYPYLFPTNCHLRGSRNCFLCINKLQIYIWQQSFWYVYCFIHLEFNQPQDCFYVSWGYLSNRPPTTVDVRRAFYQCREGLHTS